MLNKNVFKGTIKNIDVKLLLPDPNQPRQDFDEAEMDKLKNSILDKGIMTPIVVEPAVNGKHLIVDGERRFRVALDLKMKEVPVNILEKKLNEFDRNIVRFQLQETHRQWTPFEKAEAMAKLKENLELSTVELAKALAIAPVTAQRYLSLLSFPVAARKQFIKAKVSMDVIRELSYTHNIMPDKIKQQAPDYIQKALAKYKKGYLKSHELRSINQLIRLGEYKYVVKFFNQLKYTVTNAASDSGLIVNNFVETINRSAKNLIQKIKVVQKNDIKITDETKLVLKELAELINK